MNYSTFFAYLLKKMNTNGTYTYTSGFKLCFEENFTKRQFIQMLDMLSRLLNTSVISDSCVEGGIQFKGGIYDCAPYPYKSLRFNYKYYKRGRHTENVQVSVPLNNELTSDSDEVIFTQGLRINTWLKAFHGSPVWTLDELQVFKQVFEMFDVKVTRMPSKKELTSHGGNLGYYETTTT